MSKRVQKPAEPNPAVVPPPPEPVEAKYRVAGIQTVLDHPPGSTFTATLPFELEAFFLQGGHLERVED